MQLSDGTILQSIAYLVSAGATIGTIMWRIKALEKKVDKHNGLVERMVVVEQNIKASWHCIDDIKKILQEKKEA